MCGKSICIQKFKWKRFGKYYFPGRRSGVYQEELKKRSLVAFVNDGAILPRESGISSKPMKGSVTFSSPESLWVTMALPHKGKITGMGIPKGITLIIGGGYHGKSTLLNALELGVYNHIQEMEENM